MWIHVYDSELNDEQIRRLASQHNMQNTGSMLTNFVTRVHSCRQWLYRVQNASMDLDETPPSSQSWKNACQRMYVPSDKVNGMNLSTKSGNFINLEHVTERDKVFKTITFDYLYHCLSSS